MRPRYVVLVHLLSAEKYHKWYYLTADYKNYYVVRVIIMS